MTGPPAPSAPPEEPPEAQDAPAAPSDTPPDEPRRARTPGELARDTLRLYLRHLRTWILVAAAVVVPVDLAVFGLGLDQLTKGYDASPGENELVLQAAVTVLFTTPLISAMVACALLELQAGTTPRARTATMAGLDRSSAVLLAVLLYAATVFVGLLAFVIPGIFFAVKGAVAVQAVIVDKARPGDALRRSWALTVGSFGRALGVLVAANVVVVLAAALLAAPLNFAADAADAQALSLLATVLVQTLGLPLLAIATALLFFDLEARDVTADRPRGVRPGS